jgi:hypothetical protein
MADFEYVFSDESPSRATHAPRALTAVDWVTEHQDAAVERLFVLLEQNQAAIAALAHAWRHTRRALEVTQDELARTLDALAAETAQRRPADAVKSATDPVTSTLRSPGRGPYIPGTRS